MSRNPILLLLALVLFGSGCSPTRLTSVWSEASVRPVHKLIVVGIEPSIADRRVFEREFAGVFEDAGIEAFESYKLLSDNEQPNRQTLRPTIDRTGSDAILVSSIVEVTDEAEYVPGWSRVDYVGPYGFYDRYYPWAFDRVSAPGYVVSYKNYTLESLLYEARSGKLLFAATSKTMDPDSIHELADSLAEEILDQLRELGVVASTDNGKSADGASAP
ncbi:MAG: hypothetical protein KDD69_01785 [Bdellovibrionales bacterium]|nr:hypothetical protein [Bdellovibrionales bacterium]